MIPKMSTIKVDAETGAVVLGDDDAPRIATAAVQLLAAAMTGFHAAKQAGIEVSQPDIDAITDFRQMFGSGGFIDGLDDPRNASYVDLDVFQGEVREWAYRNFGAESTSKGFAPISGVAEEQGELSVALAASIEMLLEMQAFSSVIGAVGRLHHAHLKGNQGIRYTPEQIEKMKKDAVGDLIVYLADYANRADLRLSDCLEMAWGEVKHRDWLVNPMDAAQVARAAETNGGDASA